MSNLPERQPNRIPQFDYSQGGAYFITVCTHARKRLFQIEHGTPVVGNGLCAVPSGLCAVPSGLCAVSCGGDGTTHRSCPTVENQIVHKWVRETVNKYPNIAIDKYVIMPDHLHMIVTIREQHAGCSLPDVMRFFKTMTTNEYIRGVKNGILRPFDRKLWQKSYYDHVIRNQQDYNEVWEYIDNNPLKWMITKENAL